MAGAASAKVHSLGLGRKQSFRVRPSQRPSHKTTTNLSQEEGLDSYALCNRTMCLSSVTQHARHAHAQVTRETHHTRCTSSHFFSKSTSSPTVLPGAPLREVVSLGGEAVLPCGSLRSAPATKQPQTGHRKRGLTHAKHHIAVLHTYTMLCATARCVPFVHSSIHSFIHSYIHTFMRVTNKVHAQAQ